MSTNEKLRSRYLQDSIAIRLGGLAANLARISSFSKNEGHQDAVSKTLQESKWFVEWTAGELDMQKAHKIGKIASTTRHLANSIGKKMAGRKMAI